MNGGAGFSGATQMTTFTESYKRKKLVKIHDLQRSEWTHNLEKKKNVVVLTGNIQLMSISM